MMRTLSFLFCLLMIVLLAGCACAQTTDEAASALPTLLAGLEWRLSDMPSARAKVQLAEGEAYLFLPSCADLSRLTLYGEVEGLTARGAAAQSVPIDRPFDLTALFPGDEPAVYPLTLTDSRGETATLHIMRSARMAALWLVSDDPVARGREWVDSAKVDAKLSATGSMTALDENGGVLYHGALRELRGRGNTTWSHCEKKPYQIKLEDKADLLLNGKDNTARTWVLLAEAYDGSLLHNSVSLALGQALGLRGTPEYRPIDLYYDGAYRGYYLLCEKVQVNAARLDIPDYAAALEETNGERFDSAAYPLTEEQNDYGNAYRYAEGLTGGEERAFLVELDKFSYRNDSCWFITYDATTGLENPFSFKEPDVVPQEDAAYVSGLLQELIDCAVNEGTNPITGMTLEEYIDMDALARYLLVHQIAKTADLGHTSVYFYLTGESDLLFPGPLWDFDIAYAIREAKGTDWAAKDYVPYEGWMRELMTYPALQQRMRDVFFDELEPLLSGVLLAKGHAASEALLSLDDYEERISASSAMNAKLWKRDTTDVLFPTLSENVAYLRTYLTERCAWLREDMALWYGDRVERVGLLYTEGDGAAANAFLHYIITNVETAEEADGRRFVRMTVLAEEGIAFGEALTATVNGEDAEVALLNETECEIVWFPQEK